MFSDVDKKRDVVKCSVPLPWVDGTCAVRMLE
jgi:hypothetical protein